jgi:FtsP/CotA-like multicopper oxidase with cupredoxin domain
MRPWIALIVAFGWAAISPCFAVADAPVTLQVAETTITVNGKSATVYSITQPDGTPGLTAKQGQMFDVILENSLQVPTSIHWHGLILPNNQDGVPNITQFPIYPSLSYQYQFPLVQAGTFWMHSHFSMQEQELLSAPLILKGKDDPSIADQEVVILLTDFSFQSPSQIYEQLRCGGKGMKMKGSDLIDVDYDAFLANRHTLDDPEIVSVNPGKRVRLRIINGASGTNFFLSLGKLSAQAIAVDGSRIKPLAGSRFELAAAQRIDLVITIPKEGGAFPILAQGEGTDKQTGLILATAQASIPKLSQQAPFRAGPLTNALEPFFRPLSPLATKLPDQKITVVLGGNMMTYTWTLNGQSWPNVTPLIIESGTRVEITFKNTSTMGHPMHLHGHVFEVTALNDMPCQGAMRDTVYVPANGSVTIQFDANNPGIWPLHCHLLYHLEAGMMTVVRYQDYIQPL